MRYVARLFVIRNGDLSSTVASVMVASLQAMLRLLYLTPKREADLTAPNDLIYK